MSIKFLAERNGVFYYVRRVPSELKNRYPSGTIRISLKTKDKAIAVREAMILNKKYELEFKALAAKEHLNSPDAVAAAEALARQYEYNLDLFIELLVDPLLDRYRQLHPEDPEPSPQDLLNPTQLRALEILKQDKTQRFSVEDALRLYLTHNPKSSDPRFCSRATRDVHDFISTIGNLQFVEVRRLHANQYVQHKLEAGAKTATIRRMLNTLSAVFATTIRERELVMANPLQEIMIPNEGRDSSKRAVAAPDALKNLLAEIRQESQSSTALLILLQAELGTRIGELAGLAKNDVVIDHEIPHVIITQRPWRPLKTKDSERIIPLVGLALEAAIQALKMNPGADTLFPQYARDRGADSASAAVNKRLKPFGLTSHSFRHTMKDRLREAGCPKDIRDAIQGHKSPDIADSYGLGHSLKTFRSWLEKVAIKL